MNITLKQQQIAELFRDAQAYGLTPQQTSIATSIPLETLNTLLRLERLAPKMVTTLEEGFKIRLNNGQVTDDFDVILFEVARHEGLSIKELYGEQSD